MIKWLDYEQMQLEARNFLNTLKGTEVVLLFGELGSGKTSFVREVISAMGCKEKVTSPSFTILNIYSCYWRVYHFDFYRLHSAEEVYEIGFFEYIYQKGLKFIEWPEILLGELERDKRIAHNIRRIYFYIDPDKPDLRGIRIDNAK